MPQHTSTETTRSMPRGGAMLLAGERARGLLQARYGWRQGWRRG